mgnify:CR=1 FL=1
MDVKINGEQKSFENQITVTDLLKEEKVDMPDMVTVQVNGEILSKDNYGATSLNDGDEVEFLYFMGGGN